MNTAQNQSAQAERNRLVIQGEFDVVSEGNVVLTTLLGSCVAMCLRDNMSGVGGMNHFLLPGDASDSGDSLRYGVNAMELLVNGVLRLGGSRSRLEAKLFGGAHVVQGLADVGIRNATFAREFLHKEGIACVGESLGGSKARRVRYWPATGRAQQLLIDSGEIFASERKASVKKLAAPTGEVDLF